MTDIMYPIVIDNGSAYTKVGFAGDDFPKEHFPTILSKSINPYFPNSHQQFLSYGTESLPSKETSNFIYPIERGIITNWDLIERLWHYTFNEKLNVDPCNHQILITESPMNPIKNREKMTEIMFETFHIPGFYVAISALLSLLSVGRTTGLIYESGDGVTCVVPVYDGYVMPLAIERINFAGRDVTDNLAKMLIEKKYSFRNTYEKEIVRDIKEKICYLALDYNEEIEKNKNRDIRKEYKLPDGEIISIGNERFRGPECIFQSENCPHEIIYNSVMYKPFISHELLGNVVISGGCTLISGFVERLKKELSLRVPKTIIVRVCDMPERKFSAWIGGSVLASLGDFQQKCITKNEYEEYGPSVIHRNYC
ncbi:hypothetical protein SteCoe_7456 [Stentor coeruleus]|uniref:Actin n=1 Tax=Stentor coeruleus TaxID=5963 RepID=A0A1R2CMK8_9CILI|nr:hypothetical protein SteCoe_7456 [Stentor coeruleus]